MYCKYLKSVNARAIPRGGGCNTPPKKSKKGGPNLRGGGPSWHAGISKFLGGALEWKGAQILEYNPPTGNRLARHWLMH